MQTTRVHIAKQAINAGANIDKGISCNINECMSGYQLAIALAAFWKSTKYYILEHALVIVYSPAKLQLKM